MYNVLCNRHELSSDLEKFVTGSISGQILNFMFVHDYKHPVERTMNVCNFSKNERITVPLRFFRTIIVVYFPSAAASEHRRNIRRVQNVKTIDLKVPLPYPPLMTLLCYSHALRENQKIHYCNRRAHSARHVIIIAHSNESKRDLTCRRTHNTHQKCFDNMTRLGNVFGIHLNALAQLCARVQYNSALAFIIRRFRSISRDQMVVKKYNILNSSSHK